MEKRFSGFLIAIMLMASKFFNCQALLESPVKKKNVLNIRLKEQCQDLVKDSVTEGISKVRKELKKNLEDLRLDMMRRDVELYEEIYTVKENLTANDTAKEKQTTNLDDGERKVWLKKFEYLDVGIKKASQESMNNADTLQENLERLDRKNREILSRMNTMEITLMSVASQSSVNLNDSDGLIFTTYLHKLQRVDDRLTDINETIQVFCNLTTDMQKTMGIFQSECLFDWLEDLPPARDEWRFITIIRGGTICDDGWDSSDARVACRMLGYSGSYTAYENAYYGQGTGPISMDNVGCSGLESLITSCSHNGWGVHNCGHHEDASVKCT